MSNHVKKRPSWVLTRKGRWAGAVCEYHFVRITEASDTGIRIAMTNPSNVVSVGLVLNEVEAARCLRDA